MIEKALEIAELLCVPPPCPGASDEDISVWIDWYISSYDAALKMSQETIEQMKAEGRWPPVVASMIRVVPRAVSESLHPPR